MEAFVYFLVMTVISLALTYALQKRQKPPSAATLGEFEAPTAEEGRAIPVAFGTVKLKAPNVVWYGDLHVVPIKKKASSMSKKAIVGYQYYLTMHTALCHGPVEEIVSMIVGDKTVPIASKTTVSNAYGVDHYDWSVEAFDLFGGGEIGGEGGLGGNVAIYPGNETQTKHTGLSALSPFSGDLSAYPGLCHAVFGQGSGTITVPVVGSVGYTTPAFYVGNSKYLKQVEFIVRRFPTIPGLAAGKERIGDDANPACVAYEVYTNSRWGLRSPTAKIDTAAFIAAANTLYAEGFGMSFTIDQPKPAQQVLDEIRNTIDGVFYTDPATGLRSMKLIRADYDPDALLHFTADDLKEAPEITRASWSETANQVKINFVDAAQGYTQRTAFATDGANYAVQGQNVSITVTPVGVTSKVNANRIANRVLRNVTYPLAKGSLKLNRKAWSLRPGQAFKLTWHPPEGPGFTGMVLRAGTIKYGRMQDGWIEVEVAEDIFGTTFTVYDPPPDTGWVTPLSNPLAPAVQRLVEAPYQLVGSARQVYALAVRADTTSMGAQIWSEKSGTYLETGELPSMTPSGLLTADFSYRRAAVDTVGFTVSIATGRDILGLTAQNTDAGGLYRGDNIAVVDDEIVSWQTCTNNGDGTCTFAPVLRGVVDTVPVTHASGARVWFASEGMGLVDEIPYTTDLTVKAKILPFNPLGILPFASAIESTLATASRSLSPNPPGGTKVKTHKYADWPATITDDAVFSWIHRDRIAQGWATPLIDQDNAGPYTIEGTLTLEVLVGGVVKQTATGSTATGYTYTAVQRGIDDTDGSKSVVMRVTPKNGSKTGTIRNTPAIVMTGAGMCAGMYCGGIEA